MVKLCQHYLKSVQIDLIVVVHACVRRSATVGLRIEIYPQEKIQNVSCVRNRKRRSNDRGLNH